MEAKEVIIKTLKDAGEPLKSGEIADKSGIDKKEVDKAIKKLVAENVLTSPKRCYYDVK
jgi:predicted transcriptional regulator